MTSLIVPGGAIELLSIPAGTFQMGTNNRLFSEAPIHEISFRDGFLLGKYPITQSEWSGVMGYNPSAFNHSSNLPVDGVSWSQADKFCHRASSLTGRKIRLPSEAEWEYACRAGTEHEFFFGSWGPFLDDTELPWTVREALCDYAWFDLNSQDRTWPVGLKRSNPWGLHDIVGNVWEWCADVWHDGYDDAPNDGGAWPANMTLQPRCALRGGAWDMNAFRCRSSYRSFDHREVATNRFGFRVVADV